MNLQEKRQLFETIRDQDYVLKENQSPQEILEIALSELGNEDPYIRDILALEVAAYIIFKDYLSETEIKQLAFRILSDEFLFYGLDTKKENSVFKRTFSTLILAVIFRATNKQTIFTEDELMRIFEQFLTYYKDEYDFRGYTKDTGWAHFFAHSSDVLKQFFKQEVFDESWVKSYLNIATSIIQNTQYVFHHNEDERFKNALVILFSRDDIDQEILKEWLISLLDYKRAKKLPDDLNTYVNIKNILRELYFGLDDEHQAVKKLITELNNKLKV
ncbi:MAG: DUF2785 domain-containing protein [Candidatus Izimaplasma sp.]|nr:DUF2785 domain-containing protein [Candidatus Izimaplasma bacterium]